MRVTKLKSVIAILVISCAGMGGQTVPSTLVGIVVDPVDAVVGGAEAQVKDQATGAVRTVKTNSKGLFRFADIGAGKYTLTVNAEGFKIRIQKDIEVQSGDTRDLGRLSMEPGNISGPIKMGGGVAAIE